MQNFDDIKLNNLIAAGSLFIGIDNFIGPLYIAYGIAENNKSSACFYLGKIF